MDPAAKKAASTANQQLGLNPLNLLPFRRQIMWRIVWSLPLRRPNTWRVASASRFTTGGQPRGGLSQLRSNMLSCSALALQDCLHPCTLRTRSERTAFSTRPARICILEPWSYLSRHVRCRHTRVLHIDHALEVHVQHRFHKHHRHIHRLYCISTMQIALFVFCEASTNA